MRTIEGTHQETKIAQKSKTPHVSTSSRNPILDFVEIRELQAHQSLNFGGENCTNHDSGPKLKETHIWESFQEPGQEETNKGGTKGPALWNMSLVWNANRSMEKEHGLRAKHENDWRGRAAVIV